MSCNRRSRAGIPPSAAPQAFVCCNDGGGGTFPGCCWSRNHWSHWVSQLSDRTVTWTGGFVLPTAFPGAVGVAGAVAVAAGAVGVGLRPDADAGADGRAGAVAVTCGSGVEARVSSAP